MAFRVEISPEAFGDLDRIALSLQEKATSVVAERWLDGIFASIRSLREMPSRCAIAEESDDLGTEIRLLLHGRRNRRYKVYFLIREKTVRILHVRHWARKPVEADELDDVVREIEVSDDEGRSS
jgi:plasmid stabilization system protein ParE